MGCEFPPPVTGKPRQDVAPDRDGGGTYNSQLTTQNRAYRGYDAPMTFEITLIALFVASLVWLAWYMRAQKSETTVEVLIQHGDYARAVKEADKLLPHNAKDSALWQHRADALQLQGLFAESETAYRKAIEVNPRDAASREGIALSLAHRGVDLEEARRLMEETINTYPEIQEFQALSLSYILLRSGVREEALRMFADNSELLEVRFETDYTDPDDLLAETAYMYGVMSREAGDLERSELLMQRVRDWAPGSVFAKMAGVGVRSEL